MKKAFFIITRTNEMHKYIESFTCVNGNEASHYMFEHRNIGPSTQGLDADVIKHAIAYNPDLIVYIGACSGRMPSSYIFRELRHRVAPTVCIISDAADEPWWGKINEFDKEKSFTVQVAIDGGGEWPKADNHISALTPLDPKYYPNPIKPHSERKTFFGFAGNPGAALGTPDSRFPMLGPMKTIGLNVRYRDKSHSDLKKDAGTYIEAAKFMSDTCIIPNFSHTGSYKRHHVKGRVVESGWAGSLLLELKQSPAKQWFESGVDYLEYETMNDVKKIIDHYKGKPDETQAFGERLRKKVEDNHSPQKFWTKIVNRCGIAV